MLTEKGTQWRPPDDMLKRHLSLQGDISGDSDAVATTLRRRHLANRLQIGAHLMVHLLQIRIAERIAHIGGDLAEERYQAIERRPGLLDIQRDIRRGKLRPDVWW